MDIDRFEPGALGSVGSVLGGREYGDQCVVEWMAGSAAGPQLDRARFRRDSAAAPGLRFGFMFMVGNPLQVSSTLLIATFAVLGYALVSCRSERPVSSIARRSLLDSDMVALEYPSPAEWRYHPREAGKVRARVVLEDGGQLLAGERGERWMVLPGEPAARPASQLAPEELVAALRRDDGGWLFVGKSGTGYESLEPLGAFARSSAPLESLVELSAARGIIVGVRRDGALVRSDDAGAAWSRVGPLDRRFQDVAMTSDGLALALAVPEALYVSRDRGASWSPAGIRPEGAMGLLADQAAGLLVLTALGPKVYDVALGRLRPAPAPAKREESEGLGAPLPLGPSASALLSGRAYVWGGRYHEVRRHRRARRGAPAYQLIEGTLGERLTASPLTLPVSCQDARLAGFGVHQYVACAGPPRAGGATVAVYGRHESGATFERAGPSVVGSRAGLMLAVGAGGRLLVSGMCSPQSKGPGCREHGVFRLTAAPPSDSGAAAAGVDAGAGEHADMAWFPVEAPAMAGSALSLSFSVDGRTAYAMGMRTKSRELVIFVAQGDLKRFTARPVSGVELGQNRYARGIDGVVVAAAAAEDGMVGFVLLVEGDLLHLVADEVGRVASISKAPPGATALGAVGARAFALSDTSLEAWEALTPGAPFSVIGRAPVRLCEDRASCDVEVACHLGGCVVGDALSRVGWRGQSDVSALLSPPTSDARGSRRRRVAVPLVCALDPAPWRELPGSVAGVPSADQSALGDSAWFMLSSDFATASVSLLHGTVERGAPTVRSVALLDPVRAPEQFAVYATPQIEGGAAIRFRRRSAAARAAAETVDVEVAWQNLFEGRVVRQTLERRFKPMSADSSTTPGKAHAAAPSLVSIAAGGLYLRPHKLAGDQQTTYFLDGRGVTELPAIVWPRELPQSGSSEMAHVGDAHLALRFVGPGAAVARGRNVRGGWVFDAMGDGYMAPRRFGLEQSLSITYVAGRSARHITVMNEAGVGESWLMPFAAGPAVLDPPERVPTPRDLASPPGRCSTVQKRSTARVVLPPQPGARHPIVITDPVEPIRVMLSHSSVLYGTLEHPCLAALDAVSVATEISSRPLPEQAILSTDDLAHSWLFRPVPEASAAERRLEYRTMSCRFDDKMDVPPEVYKEKGTFVVAP